MDVRLPDGRVVTNVPEGTTQTELMRRLGIASQEPAARNYAQEQVDTMPALMRGATGSGEAMLQMGTGIASTPVAGLAGLLAMGASPLIRAAGADPASLGIDQPGNVVRKIRSALTYEPKTREGQAASSVINAPFTAYNWALDKGQELIQGDAPGGSARDLTGTTFNVLGQAAPTLYGGYKSLIEPRLNAAPPPPLTVRQQTLKQGQDLGYVTTPESMHQGTVLSGVAGKARVPQAMSVQNQVISNEVILRDVNASLEKAGLKTLPADTADMGFTSDMFKNVRADAGKAYEAVKNEPGRIKVDPQLRADADRILQVADNVQGSFPAAPLPAMNKVVEISKSIVASPQGFTPSAVVDYVKTLRDNARSNLSGSKVTDAERATATAQSAAADALESALDRALIARGKPDLVAKLQASREVIAKAHTYEDALNTGTGDISLGKVSKAPYVGPEVQKAVDFYNAFYKVNQDPARFGGVQIASPFDAAAAVGGTAIAHTMGVPGVGMLGGGLLGARSLALPYLMSPKYQAGLLAPKTPPPPILPLTPGLLEAEQQR